MAPRKRTQTAKNKRNLKATKLEAFLMDFDDEVHTIVERLKEKTNNLLKDADNLYKTALIKIPLTVRKMNWIEFSQMEKPASAVDDSKVKEEAAQVELAIAKNHVIPKVAGKEGKSGTDGAEESAAPLKGTVKRKAKKAPSTSKKARALSVSKQSGIQRSTRKPLITPARSLLESSVIGSTPLITPRFDPRLPKTPALRLPQHREKVYSMSVNGSPIAGAGEDVVISVPLGNGECLQLLAGEMDSVDVSLLDERALRSIRTLQNRLTALCGSSK